MENDDHIHEDINTLVGFLDQVDQFSFLYQELTEAKTKIDDPDNLREYQEAVRDEMQVIGEEGIKSSYMDAQEAYMRLDRYTERIQDALYRGEHDWLQDQKIGDPIDFYGEITELIRTFEEIDADRFGKQPL